MKAKRLNIGIDVSKLKFDICILDERKREVEYLQIFNNENSIRDFLAYLKSQYPKASYYFGDIPLILCLSYYNKYFSLINSKFKFRNKHLI